MAHYQQLKFVELVSEKLPQFFKARSVLEVGSWIANDSVRKFFVDCQYVGADVAQGPGVDIVCPGEALKFADASFDVVVSGDSFPVKKPDPTSVVDCLKRWDLKATQALFVGDSSIDAATARNAGVQVWLLPYGYNMGESVHMCAPDRVIEDFSALL